MKHIDSRVNVAHRTSHGQVHADMDTHQREQGAHQRSYDEYASKQWLVIIISCTQGTQQYSRGSKVTC